MSKCEYIIVKLSGPVSGLNKVMNWKLNAFKKQQNNKRKYMILVLLQKRSF